MKVYGVLKESGQWRFYRCEKYLDIELSDAYLAQDGEDSKYMALNMWSSLAKADQKRARISAIEREVTEEDIARVKEECDVETEKEALELLISECPFNTIFSITWDSEQEKEEEEDED